MTISLTQLTPRLMFAHLQRRRRAKRLGVNFSRRGSFRLPNRLLLGGNTIELDLLHERGTKADFLGIFLDDMYMIESLKGMRSVLDIGANQGLFSIYARSLYPDATIHAYEPNPALEAPLGKNCGPLNIAVFMEGVSEAEGSCNLRPMGDSNLTRTISADKGGVPVVGIARALERLGGQVDLLKLDCEGCEWEVFKDRESLRRVRYLTMEYHCWANGSHHTDVPAVLKSLGFDVLRQVRSTDFGQVLARRADKVARVLRN